MRESFHAFTFEIINDVLMNWTLLQYIRNILGSLSKIFGSLQKSPVIFEKYPTNDWKRSNGLGLGKCSDFFGKSPKNTYVEYLYSKEIAALTHELSS